MRSQTLDEVRGCRAKVTVPPRLFWYLLEFSEPSGLNQPCVFPTGIFRREPASDKQIHPVQRPNQHFDSTKNGFKFGAPIHSTVAEFLTSPCTLLPPKQSTQWIILSGLLSGKVILKITQVLLVKTRQAAEAGGRCVTSFLPTPLSTRDFPCLLLDFRFITARQEELAHMHTVLFLLINKLPSCLITKPLIILTVLFKTCGNSV